jgi:glycerol-3-phosphate dehydrogenase
VANISLLGCGTWGSALAQVVAENGHRVTAWHYKKDAVTIFDQEKHKAYFEKLIKEADIAMYHSKRNEDKITIYSEKIKNTLK